MALTTFIATIRSVDVSAIFAIKTHSVSVAERRVIAIRCIIIASIILLLFSLIGEFILAQMGISLAALITASSILLLFIGIDMAYKPYPEQHPANKTQAYVGMIFKRILTRLSGVLLCALAMQFIFDGIALSGLLNQ